MIRSFRGRETERLFRDVRTARFQRVASAARRKLMSLDAASGLHELAKVPGNRLESLRGDRLGQHSIRINDQFRVCFVWREDGPHAVEIVDYH